MERPPPSTRPLRYRFGDSIWLEGYNVKNATVHAGDVIRVTLFWRPTKRIHERYKVFNQIIDLDATMHGQRDGEPKCNDWPTTNWQAGELVVDRYAVPVFPDAPPGTYPLLAGMYAYDEPTNRLDVYTPEGALIGQELVLGPITVLEAGR